MDGCLFTTPLDSSIEIPLSDKMNADGSDICDESCKFDSYSVSLTSSSFPPTEEYYNTFIAPDLSVVRKCRVRVVEQLELPLSLIAAVISLVTLHYR